MTELEGEIQVLDLPHYVEGPWLHKRGDLYYLTYASMGKGREMMHYATAESIGRLWTYMGALIRNGGEQSHILNRGSLKGNGICSTIMPRL